MRASPGPRRVTGSSPTTPKVAKAGGSRPKSRLRFAFVPNLGARCLSDEGDIPMPRATWNGFLRLSLVSCPIYLTPATSEGANIRLHQLNPKTGNRVRQQLVDAETGDQVE